MAKLLCFTLTLLCLVAAPLHADSATDRSLDGQDYCSYLTEQAQAQRDLLRTPDLVGGVTQPETGLPLQAILGVNVSVANIRKGTLTMDVARQNCRLYSSTSDVQMRLTYAVPALERAALEHRLEAIDDATDKLNAMIEKSRKMLAAKNLTLPMLYTLEQAKLHLAADKAGTALRMASYTVPEMSVAPIKVLLQDKQKDEHNNQRAAERLAKQNDWDIAITAGVHGQLDQFNSDNSIAQSGLVGPYGTVSFTYNLDRKRVDQHLAAATAKYTDWKTKEFGDAMQNAALLKAQLEETLRAESVQTEALSQQQKAIDENLGRIEGAEADEAADFRNRLEADQVALNVEIEDTRFRITSIQHFLTYNF